MKNLINRHYPIAATAALTLWCCLAQAEDIEVYRGAASDVKPIAIIVIDTSGSMKVVETVDDPEYDVNINYKETFETDPEGNVINYNFNPTLYYFSHVYTGNELSSSDISDLETHPFPPQALVCEGAKDAIETLGSYTDRFKRWDADQNSWYPKRGRGNNKDIPQGDDDEGALVECKSDEGIHSDGVATGKYVDTRNSSKYRSTKANSYEREWRKNFAHIYHGNFLNFKIYSNKYAEERSQTRMRITQDAAKFVVNTTGGIKLGLSRFDSESSAGGFIDVAVDDIENIRQDFATAIDSYIPWNGTPLTETFYEAALFLKGDSVDYGINSKTRVLKPGYEMEDDNYPYGVYYAINFLNTEAKPAPSVDASRTGNTYISPITSACQRTSNIVLFTDGAPSVDDGANSDIQDLLSNANIDFTTEPNLTDADREVLTNNCSGNGGCIEELAYYLAKIDQRPDLPGMQTINTHIIGGFFDESTESKDLKRMEDIAKFGKGTYSVATNKKDIVEAFQGAVSRVFDDPTTFVAPSVAANAYNSLEHLDELYYAMFSPSADNDWQGNLKGYRLSPDGIVVDANGDPAIDNATGLFKETSRSYWSDREAIDGASVVKGGAAANLTKDKNIFTHLTDTKELLHTTLSTTNIPKEMLGVSTAEHQSLIDWLNRKEGVDTRTQMEDPLHSRPIVVNYSYTIDPEDKSVTADGVVFVGTNSGYLHAFKADKHNFEEYFSYIPKELLPNANLYRTSDKTEPKAYGVDGPINYWHEDVNQNSQVDNDEKVYLFFGLRRGGRHYYALDISDPENPKFQWKISGGLNDDFDKMGQSWSPMGLAKVPWEGKTKVVLLFGGGYDPDEDDRTSRAPNSMGNSVYMIDPESGDLLWSASNSGATTNLTDMTSSITSEIKTIDFDGDQVTDYFFVSDLGGRIWRFDINPDSEDKNDFIAGAGILFDANKNNTDYQRFYYAPSVSYFADDSGSKDKYLTLAVGSGFRAHPLQADSEDSFYIIKDPYIVKAPTTYKMLESSDLEDIPLGSQLAQSIDALGWKYELDTGEKILATPLTSGGNMYFTTFAPLTSASNQNTCNADIGISMGYNVDFKGDDDPTQDSVSPVIKETPLPNTGITPRVIEVRTSDAGQKAFCETNSSHASCQPDDCEATNSCPDDCESTGSVILSGTNVLSGGIKRCELVKKDYWRSL